jgi:hypothetical protein
MFLGTKMETNECEDIKGTARYIHMYMYTDIYGYIYKYIYIHIFMHIYLGVEDTKMEVNQNEDIKGTARGGKEEKVEGEIGDEDIVKIMLRDSMRRVGRKVYRSFTPKNNLNYEDLKWESLYDSEDLLYFKKPSPSSFIDSLIASFL